jgi:hypothetical protein
MGALARWLLAALFTTALWLPLTAWPGPALAAEPTVRLDVAVTVGNVYQFSARDKTYSIEGKLRVAAPAAAMRQWLAAGLDPIELLRFSNLVEPWNSLLEPVGAPVVVDSRLARDYRFNGRFYSDEIDFRGYPFGVLPLRLELEPVAGATGAVHAYPYDRTVPPSAAALPLVALTADNHDSSVSQRTNMNGYRLRSWRLLNRGSKPSTRVEMELVYDPIGWAALVKWLLPLSIAMVLLLLTPNLRASYASERLAIPPVILLTLVFMQQAYRDSLPSLPYLTVLDSVYAFSYCVTLLMFCEFIWCANLMQRLEPARFAAIERRIDRLEMALQLASLSGYGALVVWAWGQR